MTIFPPNGLFAAKRRPVAARLMLAAGFLLAAGAALAQQAPANLLGGAAPPAAQPSAPYTGSIFYGSISVAKGKGTMVKLPHPVANLFAADPNIIMVQPTTPDRIFVLGKNTGETNIVATDSSGNTIASYSVSVGPTDFAGDRIRSQSAIAAPGGGVTAESEPGGVVVRGTVQTPAQANDVINQAKIIAPGQTVINQLNVAEPIQVQLKVRIATMSRSVTRQLGIDWGSAVSGGIKFGKFAVGLNTGTAAPSISGTSPGGASVLFPGGTFEGIIDALASDNLAHVLAEPTLTTLSGTQASFQVGGQFPIPVASNNNTITVDFKNYGVLLTFTPTVLSDGRIALQVAPQLSTISNANSVTVGGSSTSNTNALISVPSLTITQASTTIILGSGEGMAIAGLLEDTTNQTDNAVPGLGEVPVLGALFRGDSFSRQQQEMVITVTPYLVQPTDHPGALASPDDGWTPPNDLQRILLLRDSGTNVTQTTIPGDAGFMVQ